MKVLKSLLAILVPALLLVSCGFVKTAEDKILEVYSAQLKSQGYQDILDAYTLKAETVNSPERDQYVGKIIFLKADGTEENSLPISCNLSTGQVALKPLIPDDELGRLYMELRDDAPLAMQIAAESVSLAEESDVEETAAVEVEEPIEILSTDNNGMPMWVYGTWTCKTSYRKRRNQGYNVKGKGRCNLYAAGYPEQTHSLRRRLLLDKTRVKNEEVYRYNCNYGGHDDGSLMW